MKWEGLARIIQPLFLYIPKDVTTGSWSSGSLGNVLIPWGTFSGPHHPRGRGGKNPFPALPQPPLAQLQPSPVPTRGHGGGGAGPALTVQEGNGAQQHDAGQPEGARGKRRGRGSQPGLGGTGGSSSGSSIGGSGPAGEALAQPRNGRRHVGHSEHVRPGGAGREGTRRGRRGKGGKKRGETGRNCEKLGKTGRKGEKLGKTGRNGQRRGERSAKRRRRAGHSEA